MRIMLMLLVGAVVTGIAGAQTIKKVPLQKTSAASGQEMYENYCASCHGKDGKGAGPAAVALKQTPTDLSRLAARNNGKYPADLVSTTLASTAEIPAHGSREMPVWGSLLKSLDAGQADLVRLRAVNLTEYVKSLQAK